MRILADENVPRASIARLREDGMDIASVVELEVGMSDIRVLEFARSQGRVLWTFDRDFGELIYRRRQEPPPAIIYMRFAPLSPEEPAVVLRNLLAHSEIELTGRLTVVNRDQVRQRRLP